MTSDIHGPRKALDDLLRLDIPWASTVQRCTGGAGVPLSAKRKGYIMSDVTITYQGEQVSVSREVADFLEQDRKRMEAQGKRDRRHLSQSEFEMVINSQLQTQRALEDAVLKNL